MDTRSLTRPAGAVALACMLALPLAAQTARTGTIAYWQIDETVGEGALRDAVGDYDFTTMVSTGELAGPAVNPVSNPDTGPFRSGDPTANPGATTAPRGVQANYDAVFDMRLTPWTLEGWFRNDAPPGTHKVPEIIATTRHSGSSWKGWDLILYGGRLRLLMARLQGKGSTLWSSRRFDDGAWHHFALVWRPKVGLRGRVEIFVDSKSVLKGDGVGDLGAGDTTGRRFAIGTQIARDGRSATLSWKGALDEFRFSSGALAPAQFLNGGQALGPRMPPQAAPRAEATPTPAPTRGKEIDPMIRDLKAEYRNGQVFLTWDEVAEHDRRLSVYMSAEPIGPATLGKARLLTDRLHAHSANDWYDDPERCPKASGPHHGWVLAPGAPPLDPTGGLFVHTVKRTDPDRIHFAVLAEGQSPTALLTGRNTTSKAVAAHVEPIQPIWQESGDAESHQTAGRNKALAVFLHSHQGRPGGTLTYLVFGDRTMGWREGLAHKFKVSVLDKAVLVEPYDRVWIDRRPTADETYIAYNRLYRNIETWHYGTNDKIYNAELKKTGMPTNYTERLNLWQLDWVAQAYGTHAQRVYAYGASMGTGIQRLVMQEPNRFAVCDLMVPVLDFAYESGSQSNAKRFGACCGSVDLVCNDRMPLRDRLDLVDFVSRTSRDLPPVIIRVGRNDGSVFWRRKPDYMIGMQRQRQMLFAGWDTGGHGDALRGHVDGFPDFRDFDWAIEHFALNRSFPAVTNCSLDQNPGNGNPENGDPRGFLNRGIDWMAPVESRERYEIRMIVRHPEARWPVRMDVTPRRRQAFRPAPGAALAASNVAGDGSTVEEKVLRVDPAGRITYPDFTVTGAAGNTLVIKQK